MNLKRYLLCATMALTGLVAMAANKPRTVYMYGFACSLNDSTVYFTEIQRIDSAYIDSKTGFLYGRNNYSYQLRDKLAGIGFADAMCVTSFALTQKEAEKEYLAMRKRYINDSHYTIKYIKKNDFVYLPIKAEE